MKDEHQQEQFWKAVDSYAEQVKNELDARWNSWTLDLTSSELYEVIGGLMARQVTLAREMAKTPQMWNGHVAPIILRTMVDTYITLAWIFQNPLERSRQFILYGLGQEKLTLEHHKNDLVQRGEKPEDYPYIKEWETWLNGQRFTFMTEVNVGSWSGHDVRSMAEDAGCLDLYRFAYTPFSSAAHSMWHHIVRYNLRNCSNSLHMYHRIPSVEEAPFDIDYLYRAAKYVAKTFSLFDEKTGISPNIASAFEILEKTLEAYSSTEEVSEGEHRVDNK